VVGVVTGAGIAPSAPKPGGENSLVVGATRLGWIYGKDRKWGARLLRKWAAEQAKGGPIRVFLGVKNALFTTMPIVHSHMPPGRDLALYRRVEVVEVDLADAHRRIDRQGTQLSEHTQRIARLEAGRRAG
jgi:hypothetical protein